jgi:hypothetical protein
MSKDVVERSRQSRGLLVVLDNDYTQQGNQADASV